LARNIELVVREQVNVPATWTVVPEEPRPSDIPGYDGIDIRFASDTGQQQIVRFLLSKDRQQLARLSNFALNSSQVKTVNTTGRPIRGPQNAPIEIVDFDDLECPFCAKMDAKLLPEATAHYKGLIRVVYKDFPLVSVHPWAMHGAIDANCIGVQNSEAYWAFVRDIHARNSEITGSGGQVDASLHLLDSLAIRQGRVSKLDLGALKECITKQDQNDIEESIQQGKSLNLDQTPTLFIEGERLTGLVPAPTLWATIDRALKAKGITPPK
jgi:protein-disulfide isomerase